MRMWDLLATLDATIQPSLTKIHLAGYNGKEDPLDVYRAGDFQDWQSWQSQKNFQRDYVIALIQMPEPGRWLFAGAYRSRGCKPDGDGFRYQLDELPSCKELDGRLVVQFDRPGRQSYLIADNWIDQMAVAEIRAEKLSIAEFPGFKRLHITKPQLDLIARASHPSWRAALSSVAGVYLISDTQSGKFYVGSATGEGGIWQRWCTYSSSGHAGNKGLKELLGPEAMKRAASLMFSVLEIADTHASADEVLARESHWKQVLLTRIHGLNEN